MGSSKSDGEHGDPTQPLTALELAEALGVSEDAVLRGEKACEFFSLLRASRRGREFPAFQAWTGIAGDPLKEVLAALGRPSGPAAYGFFTSPLDLLAGLTPIEALLGAALNASEEAREFLKTSADERLRIVVIAARSYSISLAA
jgi:hypothetical protein